ncbi:hypothetical protein FQN50_009580 [Emmonsiellopsis sp. PD_5]|nr:hypothetical protein FQN50_009580 [Emmonsiellopsis sp. PD_5]
MGDPCSISMAESNMDIIRGLAPSKTTGLKHIHAVAWDMQPMIRAKQSRGYRPLIPLLRKTCYAEATLHGREYLLSDVPGSLTSQQEDANGEIPENALDQLFALWYYHAHILSQTLGYLLPSLKHLEIPAFLQSLSPRSGHIYSHQLLLSINHITHSYSTTSNTPSPSPNQ